MKTICITAYLALSGCALAPDYLRPELSHQSSAGQHWPFDSHPPSRYGMDEVGAALGWRFGGLVVEAEEAYSFHGEVCAVSRDVFTLRAGYEIPLK